MLTLCMDTAYKYLSLALILDDKIIASIDELCFKKQSETIFVKLDELFKKANVKPLDIDSICISEGPGSYTGVRIAMSIAKTICEVANIDLYTISTLRLYASNLENTCTILDARANRVYMGIYDNEKVVLEDTIKDINEVNLDDYNLVGDLSLFNLEDNYKPISEAFLATKKVWKKVDKIAYLVPKYLKETDAYSK